MAEITGDLIILAHETVIDKYIKQRVFQRIGIKAQITNEVKSELKKFVSRRVKDVLNDLGDQLADILFITNRTQIDVPLFKKAYQLFESSQVMSILKNFLRLTIQDSQNSESDI